MTLYRTHYNDYDITPVELDNLFDSGGQMLCSPSLLFPSEAAALSCLGIRCSLKVEELHRQMTFEMEKLDDLRTRLDQCLSSSPT